MSAISPNQGTKASEAESMNCSICIDAIKPTDKTVQLACTHLFHQDCLFDYYSNNAKYPKSCPLCRAVIIKTNGDNNEEDKKLINDLFPGRLLPKPQAINPLNPLDRVVAVAVHNLYALVILYSAIEMASLFSNSFSLNSLLRPQPQPFPLGMGSFPSFPTFLNSFNIQTGNNNLSGPQTNTTSASTSDTVNSVTHQSNQTGTAQSQDSTTEETVNLPIEDVD